MRFPRITFVTTVAVAILVGVAAADVKIRQKAKNSGFMGFGASESEELVLLTAEKKKSTTTMRFTGGVVGFIAGKGPRTKTEIVRLDKELIWEIDEKDRTYKERTFAQMRAEMAEAMRRMESGDEREIESSEDPDKRMNVKFDVNKTGEQKSINGFPCSHVILTLIVEEEDLKTGEKRDVSYFTMDQWLTEGQEEAWAEMEAFNLKMAKAVGFAEGQKDFLAALMAQYGAHLKELEEKAKGLKGFPILSTVTIETVGGTKEDQKEVREEEPEKPKIDLPGGIGGLFGKKKEKEKKKDEEKRESAEKLKRQTIVSMTTEILEMSVATVNPTEFDLPVGLEKKD